MMLHDYKFRSKILESIPIEANYPDNLSMPKPYVQTIQRGKKNKYLKNQLMIELQQRFIQQHNPQFQKVNYILSNYLNFKINPAFRDFQSLPIKIFVCGQCKYVFLHEIHYLWHCIDFGCRVNHQRSTFFVQKVDSIVKKNNQEIRKIIQKEDIRKQDYPPNQNSFFYFVQYELKPSKVCTKINLDLYRCGVCDFKFIRTRQQSFILHCLGQCNSFGNQNTSHSFKILPKNQSTVKFVKDISNFWLNYNVLALSNNFYIKINKTARVKRQNNFLCQNCPNFFSNQELLIKHTLFQCEKLKSNHHQNYLVRKRLIIKPLKQNFYQKNNITLIVQTSCKQYSKNFPIQAKSNPEYGKASIQWQKNYFCSCCQSFYLDFKIYLTHFLITGCTINHSNNSHFLYLTGKTSQPTIEDLEENVQSEDLEAMKADIRYEFVNKVMKNIYYFYSDDSSHLLKGKYSNSGRCGQCGEQMVSKNSYIQHLFKKCQSPQHPQNNPQIKYRTKSINFYVIKRCLQDIHRICDIMKISPETIFVIKPNPLIRNWQEIIYHCGKCSFVTQNQYNFLHHSLVQCNSINHQNSTHHFNFIKGKIVGDAFDIIRQQIQRQKQVAKNEKNHKTLLIHQSSQEQQDQSAQQREKKNYNQQRKERQTLIQLQKKQEFIYEKNKTKTQRQKTQITSLPITRSTTNCLRVNYEELDQQYRQFSDKNNTYQQQYLEIYPNVDYSAQDQSSKFFCGACSSKFRRKQSLIDHMFVCKNFCHPLSSHFILTQKQLYDINSKSVLHIKDYKQNCFAEYPSYRVNKNQILCGCGANRVFGSAFHIAGTHSWSIPKGTSHFILRFKLFKCRDPIIIYLPIKPHPTHERDIFVCPCNPFKKLVYKDFANHILKRHEGKSPIFHMKVNPINFNRKIQIS